MRQCLHLPHKPMSSTTSGTSLPGQASDVEDLGPVEDWVGADEGGVGHVTTNLRRESEGQMFIFPEKREGKSVMGRVEGWREQD